MNEESSPIEKLYEWQEWPVVVIRAAAYEISDEQFSEAMHNFGDEIKKRQGLYAMVIDTIGSHKLPPSQRRILTDYLKQEEELTKKFCAGQAMVMKSSVVRGIMTAVFWMYKPPYETKVFTNIDEAIACGHKMVEARARAEGKDA